MYRRPSELSKVRYVACRADREEAARMHGVTPAQAASLASARGPGKGGRLGRPHTAETRALMSVSAKAFLAANPDHAAKRGLKTRGEMNVNWKGGTSSLNKTVRQTHEYRKWAARIRKRDQVCLGCSRTDKLEVHHLQGLSILMAELGVTTVDQARETPALWDDQNGMLFCRKCHYAIHERTYNDAE